MAAAPATANGDARQETIYDSLPYYDNELEQYPILREKVEKELAREGRPPQALHPRVPPEPTLFAVRAQRSPVCIRPEGVLTVRAEPPAAAGRARARVEP